jgi:hypothetical protein
MSIPRSRTQEDHHSMDFKNVLIEIYLTSNPLQWFTALGRSELNCTLHRDKVYRDLSLQRLWDCRENSTITIKGNHCVSSSKRKINTKQISADITLWVSWNIRPSTEFARSSIKYPIVKCMYHSMLRIPACTTAHSRPPCSINNAVTTSYYITRLNCRIRFFKFAGNQVCY